MRPNYERMLEDKLQEVCQNIADKGLGSRFDDLVDMIYEYIDDNFDKFFDEAVHHD